HAPHSAVSFSVLFGKVWYENYNQPTYVWQSSAGNDDFEPKYSLVPLIFGTLKGTFYAMLFALPLALLGAIYTSQFARPKYRQWIKNIVEIMAAIPSVVIGFLVALWLAPLVESWLVSLFLSLLLLPCVFLLFLFFYPRLAQNRRFHQKTKSNEFLWSIPLLFLAFLLSMLLGSLLDAYIFGGNAKLWLYQHLGIHYDQRNCIIIAFGLGFAVIPLIFSISEDALSSVPPSLSAASLALGASPWQTVWKVILPAASPGIFAAVMIGLGRAVGETMIVLMATGNTPIMDWSIFNGMRTLSANIAVEIPEAPVGGSLYRVLFLCAVLLFVMTFIVNTLAEIVRERLRKKYSPK
ncbi:MAG: ABC transporter permease subunit, partial [Planctomycetota bacterium]